MTEQASAAPAASEAAPVVSAPNLDGGESLTAEQAFEAYQKRNLPAESAETATAGQESAVEADAGPEEAPGETQEAEAAEPPIERPKSWSKDDDAEWQSLPRAMQQKIVARESERDKGTHRSQQEAAEVRKAADAELVQARELTKALASKLPEMETAIQEYMGRQYPEFKTYDDVVNMARQAEALGETDPFTALRLGNRVKAWEVDQNKVALQLQTAREAKQRLDNEKQSDWAKFVHIESKAFTDDTPDYAAKKSDYDKAAAETLRDLGFSDEELNKLASGEEKISLFDRRMQKLLFARIKLSEIKAAPAKAIPKAIPAVQKPGVSRAPGAASADAIQATRNKLNGTGSLEDAFALYQAKKARAR